VYVINGKGSLIRLVAGLFILVSLALAVFINEYWLILTALVGFNLIISSLTGFCPMEMLLRLLRVEEREVCVPKGRFGEFSGSKVTK